MKHINKKGFTLVELLAVIVVLAIIMIIAIPAVMKQMNNAKQGAFKIEAQKVINTAQQIYESDLMLNQVTATGHGTKLTSCTKNGGTNCYCYTLEGLGVASGGNYKGYVVIELDPTNAATYYVTLSDASYHVDNLKLSDLDTTTNIQACPSTVDACPTTDAG